MTFTRMVERLVEAFPECSIGCLKRVLVTDVDNVKHFKLAWEILIAEPKKENKDE